MSPVRAVGLNTALSFLLCLPSLGSEVAFTAVTSMATVGVLVSYGIPFALKVIYHRDFCLRRGPFQLGSFSRPVSLIAVLWICFSCIILCLPTSTPVSIENLNYSPIAVGVVFVWVIVAWLLGARRVFVGPIRNWNATDLSNLMTTTTTKNE